MDKGDSLSKTQKDTEPLLPLDQSQTTTINGSDIEGPLSCHLKVCEDEQQFFQ